MDGLKRLEPRAVWGIFDELTKIPRPSKREERVVAWLIDFAEKHNLAHRRDAIGNVVILKPASAGMEHHPTVVLQNHVDMVCEKDSDHIHDFETDPIDAYVDGDWVRARGTTLGADNGLGMAAALAILIDPTVTHGPLEALFTVDEETGLTGAFNLGPDMISGQYLINLDSEDEGEVFIGCAGGIDTLGTFDLEFEPTPQNHLFFTLSVSGLLGGHSGDDIHKGRGNANKILARALWGGLVSHNLRLSHIDGGNLRNAIPREAHAIVAIPTDNETAFASFVSSLAADITAELAHSDPDVKITLEHTFPSPVVINHGTTNRLVSALIALPNGPQAMSFAMPGLVETSTNLASVKPTSPDKITVTTSQRSSIESAKLATAQSIGATLALAAAHIQHSDGYPGWTPNPASHLLSITKTAYQRLFNSHIKVRAIHAGLECGLFLKKFPHLDMISTGPTILGAHSPNERILIPSVTRFYNLLLEILRSL
jgi:dipeptidase D